MRSKALTHSLTHTAIHSVHSTHILMLVSWGSVGFQKLFLTSLTHTAIHTVHSTHILILVSWGSVGFQKLLLTHSLKQPYTLYTVHTYSYWYHGGV